MLRLHVSQKIVFPKESFPNRTTTASHQTVETVEALHLWMHGLHMPYEVFVVPRASIQATGYSTFEVSAVRFGVSIEEVTLLKGLQTRWASENSLSRPWGIGSCVV